MRKRWRNKKGDVRGSGREGYYAALHVIHPLGGFSSSSFMQQTIMGIGLPWGQAGGKCLVRRCEDKREGNEVKEVGVKEKNEIEKKKREGSERL